MEDSESEVDVFQIFRMKYAEDLEEILECPVCLEIPQPKRNIPMCEKGHHICLNCKILLQNRGEKCPTCQCNFSHDSRNYVAEKLCEKFEDIKNSILDPKHASNRRNVSSKQVQTESKNNSVETQTQTQTEKLEEDDDMPLKENSVIIMNNNNGLKNEVDKMSVLSVMTETLDCNEKTNEKSS